MAGPSVLEVVQSKGMAKDEVEVACEGATFVAAAQSRSRDRHRGDALSPSRSHRARLKSSTPLIFNPGGKGLASPCLATKPATVDMLS